MNGLNLKEALDDLTECSKINRFNLEQDIAEAVDALGESYDEYIELSLKHDKAKKHLAKLVQEFDERFADEASRGAPIPHKGETYRAVYEASKKNAVLTVAPEVLFNHVGLTVFSVSVKECRKELTKVEFDSFFHNEWGSRSLKAVSKYG